MLTSGRRDSPISTRSRNMCWPRRNWKRTNGRFFRSVAVMSKTNNFGLVTKHHFTLSGRLGARESTTDWNPPLRMYNLVSHQESSDSIWSAAEASWIAAVTYVSQPDRFRRPSPSFGGRQQPASETTCKWRRLQRAPAKSHPVCGEPGALVK